MKLITSLEELEQKIMGCQLCPRLVEFRENVPAKKTFENDPHWRKPIPGFGDKEGWLLIVASGPAPQGGNRTGRIFTGDPTGDFLMKALHETDFANQPHSVSRDDGLRLMECFITDIVRCTPPQHKPTRIECLNCRPFLEKELALLKNISHVLLLGRIAFTHYMAIRHPKSQQSFGHGMRYPFPGLPTVYASYHPSPRNTNTGRLAYKAFIKLLRLIRTDRKKAR
jgi:uracil-DNA glycosylase family 4